MKYNQFQVYNCSLDYLYFIVLVYVFQDAARDTSKQGEEIQVMYIISRIFIMTKV